MSYPFLVYFSCSSCCFLSRSSFTSFLLVLFLGYFSEGPPGLFAFSPLRHLPLLLLLLGVLRLLLLLLPLLSFMSLHAAFPASWVFGVLLFSSFITAASSSSSSVFPSFSPKLFRSSSSSVFVSGLLCLLAPWFPMFFAVFSFSGVLSFLPYTRLLSFFFVLSSLLFQLGVRVFGGGGFSLFVASSVILHRRSSECGF